MKIFVGYGYNDRDKWVKELVYPIIRAFGDEVLSGEVVYGDVLSDGVIDELRRADAMLAFLTRRADESGTLTAATHPWVVLEIGAALRDETPVVPVQEVGVLPPAITTIYPTIPYEPTQRDRCLVEIIKALSKLHGRGAVVQLELLPEDSAAQIRAAIRKPGFKACFQVLDEVSGEEGPLREARVVPMGKGGLRFYASDVRADAVLRVQIEGLGRRWVSDYKAIDCVGIFLEEQ